MQRTRRVLNVFLASPNDVVAERTLAEEVVSSVNRLLAPRLGWQIDLKKWEDTTPGYGRPQEIIDAMVDECDLFVGLLWERWGQPTGEYTSGFEEEYARATRRRKKENAPEIWLFFKQVDQSKLRDPGDQLRRVIDFKTRLIVSNEVLFKDIKDTDDWKTKLRDSFLEYLLELGNSQNPQSSANGVGPVIESPDTSALDGGSQGRTRIFVPKQLKRISTSLSQALQTGALGFDVDQQSVLQEFEVARLFLLSATLMFHRYTRDTLGTHEINVLYKYREELEMTAAEEFQILRAIVENTADLKPGWFWFRKMRGKSTAAALLALAGPGSSDDVRARALDLMASAHITVPAALLPLDHDSATVKQSAFSYLAKTGDARTLSLLDKLAIDADSSVSASISGTRLKILMRLDPNRAFSELVAKDEYISDDDLEELLPKISKVDDQGLLNGVESSWEQMRKISVQELIKRNKLSQEQAMGLTKDPSLKVREIAFQALAAFGGLPDFDTVRKALKEDDEESSSGGKNLAIFARLFTGKSVPDIDGIIVAFYATRSTDELLAAVDWFSIDGYLAYRALALHRFQVIASDLRLDLKGGFKRIKEESSQRLQEQFGAERWGKLSQSWERLDTFITKQFTQAALLGLAKNADPKDAELVRPYLGESDHQLLEPAVDLISKVGSPTDASTLLDIAKSAHGEAQKSAAAGALRISSEPVEAAQELMGSVQSEVVKIAFDWMLSQKSPAVKSFFLKTLNDQKDSNRIKALRYFSSLKGREMRKLLKQYLSQEAYYYNVVTWLDRLLYSPQPLRHVYAQDLARKAD